MVIPSAPAPPKIVALVPASVTERAPELPTTTPPVAEDVSRKVEPPAPPNSVSFLPCDETVSFAPPTENTFVPVPPAMLCATPAAVSVSL